MQLASLGDAGWTDVAQPDSRRRTAASMQRDSLRGQYLQIHAREGDRRDQGRHDRPPADHAAECKVKIQHPMANVHI